jgi:hypothetical protein
MFVGIGVGIGRQRFASGIFSAYASRVAADGGVTEAGACVDAVSTLLQTASLLLVPSGYKSGKAYAQIPTNGNGDLTWTRASTANRTNSSGNIELMATGVPRLSYMYGSCPALLLEPQRTNLCLYSQTFSDTSWIALNSTKVSTNNTDPSNTSTALNVTWTSGGSKYFYRMQTGLTIGATYTITFYVKSSNASKFRIYSESLGFTSANFTTTSDFQRFQLTYTAAVISGTFGFQAASDNTAADLIVAFAQLELGAYSTTYIPTTTASATRVADSASKTGISSLIGQTEGTLFLDFIFKASDSSVVGQIALSDSAKLNRVILWNNFTFNTLALQLKANNVNAINNVSLGTFVDGTRYKIAIAYKSGNTAVYVNGTQTITNSSTFTFSSSLTDFILSSYETTLAGHQFCFKSAVFTTRLINSDLVSLTT